MPKKKSSKKEFYFSKTQLVSTIFISVILGLLIGSMITYKKDSVVISKTPKELEELVDTYYAISKNYYKKISKKKLLNAAIEGMINSLDDPYSTFMDEKDSLEFNETVDGEYKGVGLTIKQEENNFVVISLIPNSPAKKSGIKVGDQIIEINHELVNNKSLDEVSTLIKNSKGKISIKIVRNHKEHTYELKKETVDVPTTSSKTITKEGKKVGYISITVFSSNTHQQFLSDLKKLEKKKIDSLIIDVRNNPGGHLDQVRNILDIFLDKKKVLYQIHNEVENKKVYASTKEKRKYNIVVLINKNSASASEILAAAIKESYKGKVVGLPSYGKGSVQKQYRLSSGSSVKYTVKKWLTPNGGSIDKVGVEPNEIVEQGEEYYNNPKDSNDIQLQKALELLK